MINIDPDFTRVDQEIIELYSEISPATIGHLLEKEVCDPEIRPVFSNIKLVGTVLTVQIFGKDISAISKAYELAQPGDVLVVKCENVDGLHYACAGEMSTYKSKKLG